MRSEKVSQSVEVADPDPDTGDPDTGERPIGAQPPASPPPLGAATQPTVTVDDSAVRPLYANFCRISSTPEELILDLGLNPNPMSAGEMSVKIVERVIVNHYTAKRLLAALASALQRHEQVFGVLETDVRRRIREP